MGRLPLCPRAEHQGGMGSIALCLAGDALSVLERIRQVPVGL